MIRFQEIQEGTIECTLDLTAMYTNEEIEKFNKRWQDFFTSDEANVSVIERNGNTITYSHKSWIPQKKDSKPSVLMLFGNPAPHSVRDDIYFSYEGNGAEHRFWKVFRELKYINIDSNSKIIKHNFFNLKYDSPFRLGFEVIYTFPSTASKPKWSGVAGVERLFSKKVTKVMLESEKERLLPLIKKFTKEGGAIIALQKNAYNAIAQNDYNVNQAVNFELKSTLDNSIKIYGTPPTRWLYTRKMKDLLKNIKKDILSKQTI